MDNEELIIRVTAAARLFLAEQRQLLELNANERSMTHWLAVYLQRGFPEHTVDCEYNRKGTSVKRMVLPAPDARSDDEHAKTIFPDILVHRRVGTDNLVVVEAKKSNNTERCLDDAKSMGFSSAMANSSTDLAF